MFSTNSIFSTVEPCYIEDLGAMKITLLYMYHLFFLYQGQETTTKIYNKNLGPANIYIIQCTFSIHLSFNNVIDVF